MAASIKSGLTLRGHVRGYVYRKGVLISSFTKKNLVVTTGREFAIQGFLPGASAKKVNYFRLGRGSTAPTAGQVALDQIITGLLRATADTAAPSGVSAIFVHTWTTTEFSATGVKEAGLFTQLTSGAGIMFARVTFTSQNITNSDVFKLVWKVVASAA